MQYICHKIKIVNQPEICSYTKKSYMDEKFLCDQSKVEKSFQDRRKYFEYFPIHITLRDSNATENYL